MMKLLVALMLLYQNKSSTFHTRILLDKDLKYLKEIITLNKTSIPQLDKLAPNNTNKDMLLLQAIYILYKLSYSLLNYRYFLCDFQLFHFDDDFLCHRR